MKKRALVLALMLSVMPAVVLSAGNADRGKEIYDKRCWWCHGEEGAGDGPAAETLMPPPRDFTSAMYKFKTTPFEDFFPSDKDLFDMIKGERTHNSIVGWTGMNDSSMPGWADMLKEQDIWDLVEYIKTFGGLEELENKQMSFDGQVQPSEESIAKGRELFKDRCAECHGEEGRGDATKKLKDDLGFRTWPRNLTKGWSFRISNDPKDIFARVTTGIPGTQMPSFADPESAKKLTAEERWHVANYVASLDTPYKKPTDNTVLKALRIEGELPATPDDAAWEQAEYTSYYLIPQIIAKERHFTPSLNSISVKALYNDKDIALLLEWDDRTRSLPGDKKAEEIADGEVFPDAVAVQLPVTPKEGEKPYFGEGDAANPVNIWYWRSEGGEGEPQKVVLYNAKGFAKKEERDPAEAGLKAAGAYDKGTWKVVMTRPLATGDAEKDIQFVEGKFIPIAFAAWDGSNQEKGPRHVMTTWYWVLLKPEAGIGVYAWPVVIALLIFGGEIMWLRSARKG